jgi:hypothetical protein
MLGKDNELESMRKQTSTSKHLIKVEERRLNLNEQKG